MIFTISNKEGWLQNMLHLTKHNILLWLAGFQLLWLAPFDPSCFDSISAEPAIKLEFTAV